MVEEEKRSSVWGEAATSLFFSFFFHFGLYCCNFFYINAQSVTDLNNNVVNHQTA